MKFTSQNNNTIQHSILEWSRMYCFSPLNYQWNSESNIKTIKEKFDTSNPTNRIIWFYGSIKCNFFHHSTEFQENKSSTENIDRKFQYFHIRCSFINHSKRIPDIVLELCWSSCFFIEDSFISLSLGYYQRCTQCNFLHPLWLTFLMILRNFTFEANSSF